MTTQSSAQSSAQTSTKSSAQASTKSSAQFSGQFSRHRVTLISIICVIAVLVAIEILARIVVANIAKQQVEQSLPPAVTADVSVSPTGWCVTCEVIAGKLTGLDLSSDNLRFDDMQGAGRIHASGIAFRGDSGADTVNGTFTVSEHDLNLLLQRVAAESGLQINNVQVSENGVSYATSFDAFGQRISVDVTASLHTRGDGQLQIRGEEVALASADHATTLNLEPQRFTFQTCLASRLPKELEITHVETASDEMRVQFRTRETIRFDGSAFQELGSC